MKLDAPETCSVPVSSLSPRLSFLSYSPPSARSSSAQRIAFQYYGFFLSKQKSLPFGPLFFYQFFSSCRLSRWSLDWDPPMNSGRILIDVNQKS